MEGRYLCKYRILLSALAVLICLCGFAFAEEVEVAIIASGTHGDNIQWSLDSDGELTLSGTGDTISTLQSGWHEYEQELRSVVIEDGITSICNYLFQDCASLESLSIPDSVTFIGRDAFYRCTNLSRVYAQSLEGWLSLALSEDVSSHLSEYALWCGELYIGGELLTDLVIPGDVETVRYGAFNGCTSLERVIVSPGVTAIGYGAFDSCVNLETVSLPEGLQSVGVRAFNRCTSLQCVSLPESVTLVDHFAFYRCTGMNSLTVCGGSVQFGVGAFESCENLRWVLFAADTLPAPNSRAFEYTTPVIYCKEGSEPASWAQQIGYEVVLIDPADFSELNVLKLPEGLYTMGGEAFLNINANVVVIPDGIEVIPDGAFSGNGQLLSVYMPNSVTFIAEDAFEGCTNVRFICESENAAAEFAADQRIPYSIG